MLSALIWGFNSLAGTSREHCFRGHIVKDTLFLCPGGGDFLKIR